MTDICYTQQCDIIQSKYFFFFFASCKEAALIISMTLIVNFLFFDLYLFIQFFSFFVIVFPFASILITLAITEKKKKNLQHPVIRKFRKSYYHELNCVRFNNKKIGKKNFHTFIYMCNMNVWVSKPQSNINVNKSTGISFK